MKERHKERKAYTQTHKELKREGTNVRRKKERNNERAK